MNLWISLLFSAQLVFAWNSPLLQYNKSKSVQRKVLSSAERKNYTSDEWQKIVKSLEPKLDGPVLTMSEEERKLKLKKQEEYLKKAVRVINGKTSNRGQYPWQVGILIDEESFCGGSLISPNYILTAAHCVEGAKYYAVVMGAQNRSAFEPGRLTIELTNAIVHPKWNKDLVINDLALLPLPYSVPESRFIKTIRLPKKSAGTSKYENVNATVCGWGKTSDDDTGPSPNLDCARLKVIPNTDCATLYGTDSFKASNLCAQGYNEMSICNGDSGGPIVMQEKQDKVWTLIGLVSYGAAASCQVGYPDVFTRISSFLGWITNQTGIAVRP